ncbi:MAG TPA: hypothetical protein VM532_12845 [Burkholderiales bacterium]|nr:hypothetical protein [Burkholderiales bacterium]
MKNIILKQCPIAAGIIALMLSSHVALSNSNAGANTQLTAQSGSTNNAGAPTGSSGGGQSGGAQTGAGGGGSKAGAAGTGGQTGGSTGTQQGSGQADQGAQGAATSPTQPVVVLVPVVATDPVPTNGCWVQVFENGNYQGNSLLVAGPRDLPNMRGFSTYPFSSLGDSIVAGPKARVTLYEDENYSGTAVKVAANQRIGEVSQKFGPFESMESVRVTCSG